LGARSISPLFWAISVVTVMLVTGRPYELLYHAVGLQYEAAVLRAKLSLMPFIEHVLVLDHAIYEQIASAQLSIYEKRIRKFETRLPYPFWGKQQLWLRSWARRKGEVVGESSDCRAVIGVTDGLSGWSVSRVRQVDNQECRFAGIYSWNSTVANEEWIFGVDERSSTILPSVPCDDVQSDRHDNIYYGEYSNYQARLFSRLVISPEAFCGVCLWGTVPSCTILAIWRGGRFVWLIFAFVLAHRGAYLLGLFTV